MLPMFQSGTNGAPFKAFHSNMIYPSVRGLLDIRGTFAVRGHLQGYLNLRLFKEITS